MQTAAKATSGTPQAPHDWQNTAAGVRPSTASSTPHVLARLPDLRTPARPAIQPQPAPEPKPQRTSSPPPAPATDSAVQRAVAEQMTATVEMLAESRSEFFDPQGLASIDQVWHDGRDWLSRHSKAVLIVLALLASHGALLMWRRAPAEQAHHPQPLQALDEVADSQPADSESLRPVPMATEEPQIERVPATDVTSTPSLDEPHLALPRPEPDPISMSVPPNPVVPEDLEQQPRLAAMSKRNAAEAKSVNSAISALPKPEEPVVEPSKTPSGAATDDKDIPPWDSWPGAKPAAPSISPATEAAAQATPVLASPSGSDSPSVTTGEARTASLSADRPSSRATSSDRPRSLAKLKGTIGKPLADPAGGPVRRSLY